MKEQKRVKIGRRMKKYEKENRINKQTSKQTNKRRSSM